MFSIFCVCLRILYIIAYYRDEYVYKLNSDFSHYIYYLTNGYFQPIYLDHVIAIYMILPPPKHMQIIPVISNTFYCILCYHLTYSLHHRFFRK